MINRMVGRVNEPRSPRGGPLEDPPDRASAHLVAEIGHILGVCGGQFQLAISDRLDHLLQTRDKVAEVEWPTVAAALNVAQNGYVTPRYSRTWKGLTSTSCQGGRGVW